MSRICVVLTSWPVLNDTVQLLYSPPPTLASSFGTSSGLLFKVKFTECKIHHFISLLCFGHVACGMLVSRPGIKTPRPCIGSVGYHWTSREFLKLTIKKIISLWMCGVFLCTGVLSVVAV